MEKKSGRAVWLCGAALAIGTSSVDTGAQRNPQEDVPRSVTATGCVLRVEQVLGDGPDAVRGAPQFILMNATITTADAARPDTGDRSDAPAEASGGARGAPTGGEGGPGRGADAGGRATTTGGQRAGQAAGDRPPNAGAGGRAANSIRQYLLESSSDLSTHVGQQIEVSGSLEPIAGNPASPDAARRSGNPVLRVKSIKALGKPCRR